MAQIAWCAMAAAPFLREHSARDQLSHHQTQVLSLFTLRESWPGHAVDMDPGLTYSMLGLLECMHFPCPLSRRDRFFSNAGHGSNCWG